MIENLVLYETTYQNFLTDQNSFSLSRTVNLSQDRKPLTPKYGPNITYPKEKTELSLEKEGTLRNYQRAAKHCNHLCFFSTTALLFLGLVHPYTTMPELEPVIFFYCGGMVYGNLSKLQRLTDKIRLLQSDINFLRSLPTKQTPVAIKQLNRLKEN